MRTYKRKFNGTSGEAWHGDLVDAIGERWLVVYYEAPKHEAGEPQQTVAHALRYFGLDSPLSVLVSFDEVGDVLEYQCDSGLPATIEGRDIAFVDLDLDLIARPGAEPFERDHDQFARRRESMDYSKEAIDAAYAGLELARELHRTGACPFDGHPERTLGKVLASRGPV